MENTHQDKHKMLMVSKKVFVHRNSVLTDLMETNPHIQSLYNLLWTLCIFMFVFQALLYIADPSMMWDDFRDLQFCLSKFTNFVMFCLTFNLIAFAFYEGFKLWITVRNKINSKVADMIFLFLYIITYFSAFVSGELLMLKTGMGRVAMASGTFEQIRIYMKILSYIRENIPRVLHYKLRKDENQYKTLYPTRKHYLYFLFAPTLVYRDSYPRTKTVRPWKGLFHLLEVFIIAFVTYCNFMSFYKVGFRYTGLKPFTKKEAALLFAGSLFVGPMQLLMMNYGLLHSWCNFTAEFLRFGDKEFYQDWWNESNFMHYYRKWNVTVHEWLHTFIYADSRKMGCSPLVSLILTFVISAFFHDLISCVMFGHFYPMFIAVHFLPAVVISSIPATRKFMGSLKWLCIFFFWSAIISLYTMEFYARKNCLKKETTIDFFKLRTWDPSCQIFDFSFF